MRNVRMDFFKIKSEDGVLKNSLKGITTTVTREAGVLHFFAVVMNKAA